LAHGLQSVEDGGLALVADGAGFDPLAVNVGKVDGVGEVTFGERT